MTQEPVRISGELTPDPDMCHFHVNRLLSPDLTLVFQTAAEGLGSPLVDRLFAVGGIRRVMIVAGTITVEKSSPSPWPDLANPIAKAIRETLSGEAPPIAPTVAEKMKSAPMDEVETKIRQLFEEQINPALAGHGGYVRLVKVENRDVHVEMGGGCQGCASARATMQHGVETAIRRIAPQIGRVIDVTNHAAGESPYYS